MENVIILDDYHPNMPTPIWMPDETPTLRSLPKVGWLFNRPTAREVKNDFHKKLIKSMQTHIANKKEEESFTESINHFLQQNHIIENECEYEIKELITAIRALDSVANRSLTMTC